MGRKQKHPEHKEKAATLMKALLDEVVALWTGQESPELKAIAEEIEISPAKLRKLLISNRPIIPRLASCPPTRYNEL